MGHDIPDNIIWALAEGCHPASGEPLTPDTALKTVQHSRVRRTFLRTLESCARHLDEDDVEMLKAIADARDPESGKPLDEQSAWALLHDPFVISTLKRAATGPSPSRSPAPAHTETSPSPPRFRKNILISVVIPLVILWLGVVVWWGLEHYSHRPGSIYDPALKPYLSKIFPPVKDLSATAGSKEHVALISPKTEPRRQVKNKPVKAEKINIEQKEEVLADISRDLRRQRAGKPKYKTSTNNRKHFQLRVLGKRLLLSFAQSSVKDFKKQYLVPKNHIAKHHQKSVEAFAGQWFSIRDQGEKLGIDWSQTEYAAYEKKPGKTAGGDLDIVFRAGRKDYTLSLSLIYSFEKVGWYIMSFNKIETRPALLVPKPRSAPDPLRGDHHFTGNFPEKGVKAVYFNYSTDNVIHEELLDYFVLDFSKQRFPGGEQYFKSKIFTQTPGKDAAASLAGLVDVQKSGEYLARVQSSSRGTYQVDIDGKNIFSTDKRWRQILFLEQGEHPVEILYRPNQAYMQLINTWNFNFTLTPKEHLFSRNEFREERLPITPETRILYAATWGRGGSETGYMKVCLSRLEKPALLFLSTISELGFALEGPGLEQLKAVIFTGPDYTRISGIQNYSIPVYRMLKGHGLPRLESLESKRAQNPQFRYLMEQDYGIALWNLDRLFPGMKIDAFSINADECLEVPGKPLSEQMYSELMTH